MGPFATALKREGKGVVPNIFIRVSLWAHKHLGNTNNPSKKKLQAKHLPNNVQGPWQIKTR